MPNATQANQIQEILPLLNLPGGKETEFQKKDRENAEFFAVLQEIGQQEIQCILAFQKKLEEAMEKVEHEDEVRKEKIEEATQIIQANPEAFNYPSRDDMSDKRDRLNAIDTAIEKIDSALFEIDIKITNLQQEIQTEKSNMDAARPALNKEQHQDVNDFFTVDNNKPTEEASNTPVEKPQGKSIEGAVTNFLGLSKEEFEANKEELQEIISSRADEFREIIKDMDLTTQKSALNLSIKCVGLSQRIMSDLRESDNEFLQKLGNDKTHVKEFAKFVNEACKGPIEKVQERITEFFSKLVDKEEKLRATEKTKEGLEDSKEKLETQKNELSKDLNHNMRPQPK